jgi:MoxR-like ATPase
MGNDDVEPTNDPSSTGQRLSLQEWQSDPIMENKDSFVLQMINDYPKWLKQHLPQVEIRLPEKTTKDRDFLDLFVGGQKIQRVWFKISWLRAHAHSLLPDEIEIAKKLDNFSEENDGFLAFNVRDPSAYALLKELTTQQAERLAGSTEEDPKLEEPGEGSFHAVEGDVLAKWQAGYEEAKGVNQLTRQLAKAYPTWLRELDDEISFVPGRNPGELEIRLHGERLQYLAFNTSKVRNLYVLLYEPAPDDLDLLRDGLLSPGSLRNWKDQKIGNRILRQSRFFVNNDHDYDLLKEITKRQVARVRGKVVPSIRRIKPGDDGKTEGDELKEKTSTAPRYWWVFQGQNYEKERDDGYVSAGKGSRKLAHHMNVGVLKRGDILLHSVAGRVQAIGRVTKDGTEDANGYTAGVEYHALAQPILVKAISSELRRYWRGGPFDRKGGPNEGYLFELTDPFVEGFSKEFGANLPEIWPDQSGENGTNTSDGATEPIVKQVTFEEIWQALRAQGLYYSREVLANYLLALQTKRFVILTGISGTGKTRLAQAVAGYLSDQVSGQGYEEGAEKSYRVVAVRPDWTDNRGLLGYYNPIIEEYTRTPFLDLLLEARRDADVAAVRGWEPRAFFIVLDEMNLARVEHYFSDFLSVMESDEEIALYDEARVSDQGEIDNEGVPSRLRIPKNIFFTGTVNVDETTYMFSPKVLDRAFTIELNEVNLEDWGRHEVDGLEGEVADDTVNLVKFPGTLKFERKPSFEDWAAFGKLLHGELQRVVVGLNKLLEEKNRHFGYRSAGEIARFVRLASEQTEGEGRLWAALDLAILQKVLPKLSGTQQELEEVLTNLLSFATSADATIDDESMEEKKPRLPRTAGKIERMLQRLREQGFTAFIE